MSIDPSIPEIQYFLNLTLKIEGEGEMTMMLHNYTARKFHITSNGINLSSGFRDMASTKPGPRAASCDKFWAMGSPYGANGPSTMTVHIYKSRQDHKTLNGLNPSSGFRDLRSAKSGPNLCQIWQVFGPWASPYGANWQMIPHNFERRKSVKRLQRYGLRKSVSRPPGRWRQYPFRPEDWGVKCISSVSIFKPLRHGDALVLLIGKIGHTWL